MSSSTGLPKATSFHQVIAYRAQELPDHTWFYYPEPANAAHYRSLTFKDTDMLLDHLAAQYEKLLPIADSSTVSKTAPASIPQPPLVTATLCSSNVQLLLTGLAVQRLQHAYAHISPLNSDAGIVSLMKSVDAKVLIADNVFYERAASLAAQVEGIHIVRMIKFDPVDELKKDLKTFAYDKTKDEGSYCSAILHTSGTTSSTPKPIWHTNKSFLEGLPLVIRKTTLALGLFYHGMAGAVALMAAQMAGSMAIPLAKDCNHRTLPEVFNSLKALQNVDRLMIYPILAETILEIYGQTNGPEIEYLRRLESVEVWGGKLSSEVARALLDLGINVRTVFASTEVGLFPLRNEPTEEHWDSFVSKNDYHCKWEHIEGDQYELLINDPPVLGLNLGVPQGGVFRTNDVFEEYPSKSGKYVYIGRRDLMLIHSNGINTNPVPWENALRPLEEIEECQLVGHGRRGPGLLIELNWSKVEDEEKARATIWAAIEEYNKTVLVSSRVQHQEAMFILPRGSHLERSDKETVKRGVNIKKFEQEINQGYQNWNRAAPFAKV
ncbi:hypothetical protein K450DRAFT_274149 [Umbelopsis ramanniana AG]|uniref:AMP-dependent synthetase/ligase domain-containing protein n=1 Tax=Umbelopsis ramanniana AG TaxID=1314678 RepID=A0AAD5HCF6_UMBRA|nr:uncharacterized protein K450DRAFT_274149 [Umbelopsis ramanniana AG]KAI8577128.1 hypothetical protein K450DRAFT_274149 [Umbelopsis ramanniana AG]